MRIALLSDVHANLPALRAVLDDIAAIGCDAVWCAGDVVGRGPHPNEVVEELRRLEIPTVQGNWDEAVSMGREVTGSIWATPEDEADGHANLAWTLSRLTDENCTWLRQLPDKLRLEVHGRSALLFHGTPLKQNEYLWDDRPSRYFGRIAFDEGDDLFCFGHSHQHFHKVVGQAHFVAAGSVGCGDAEDPRARYAVIYVTEADLVVGFRAVEYDYASVARDLVMAGLSINPLRVPPVPHPLVDPGTVPIGSTEPAQA
ncbi:MAG TPA: metallophosphoesterase family protein [candidate division Zixibacteria bacterium]|nr:metallophosphoesterase family protein [candidate division Zixibacteria bacterium]